MVLLTSQISPLSVEESVHQGVDLLASYLERKVQSVVPSSQAERAGVRVDDVIESIGCTR
jgi:C-terminal processing protease CtpA/Prc